MSCPVYDDGSTVMHIEKAEVRRLRAIEAAARVLVFDEPDTVDKRLGALGLELEAALNGGANAERGAVMQKVIA